MTKLLIVESPTKAKTISAFLGSEYIVKASVGHFRDLPRHEMGVEPPNYKPKYEINPEKKDIVNALKKLASTATHIYLGTDADREGEAIAWHLKEALKIQDPQRIIFHDVNKPTILAALAAPRKIDMKLVHAQEARRISDRLVGYTLSPLSQRASGINNLSVGRVQSIAVRLVVDREREIMNFTPTAFYSVEIVLSSGLRLTLALKSIRPDLERLTDPALADVIAMVKEVTIHSVETKPRTVSPKSALTTSLLQQTANAKLKMSLKLCMSTAQALFDKGLITYHRTDDPNMSDAAYEKLCVYLKSVDLEARRGKRIYKSKEGAQEAHEAIRPYDFAVEDFDGTDDEKRLYTLIRDRAIRSQMPDAEEDVTTITAEDQRPLLNDREQEFKAKFTCVGRVETVAGWRSYKRDDADEDKEEQGSQVISIQPTMGAIENVVEAKRQDKMTNAPKRFTEGSLVNEMERLGIGRPSTWASVVTTIVSHGFVTLGDVNDKKKPATALIPKEIGFAIVDTHYDHRFLNYDFTSKVEQQLDDIAAGSLQYLPMVRDMHALINEDLSMLKFEPLHNIAKKTGSVCPKCNALVRRLKSKDKGTFFWVHAAEEHDCEKYLSDDDGKPIIKIAGTVASACPKCTKPVKRLTSKDSKDSFYWVHIDQSDAEGCDKYFDDDKGQPRIKITIARPEAPCPACGLIVRRFPSKDTKRPGFYWMHLKDTDSCSTFLRDDDGKPVAPTPK